MAAMEGSPTPKGLAAQRDDALRAGQIFSGFEVLAVLGRGGMGEVYLAREEFTDRRVALKVLPIRKEASQDARERMQREAAAGVRIDHPNVVRVYGGGLSDGKVYISMQWLEGAKTLRELLVGGPVPVHVAILWATKIADALNAIHLSTIWHRDLKPENVMVQPSGEVKLIDFGLARVRSEHLRTTKPPNLGTPHYMAPEQSDASLGPIEGPVDVYALGLILFEMIVGRHALEGDDTDRLSKNEVTMRHLIMAPQRLADVTSAAPPELSRLVDATLAKRPAQRPTAREVAKTLRAIAVALDRTRLPHATTDPAGHRAASASRPGAALEETEPTPAPAQIVVSPYKTVPLDPKFQATSPLPGATASRELVQATVDEPAPPRAPHTPDVQSFLADAAKDLATDERFATSSESLGEPAAPPGRPGWVYAVLAMLSVGGVGMAILALVTAPGSTVASASSAAIAAMPSSTTASSTALAGAGVATTPSSVTATEPAPTATAASTVAAAAPSQSTVPAASTAAKPASWTPSRAPTSAAPTAVVPSASATHVKTKFDDFLVP